MRKHKRLISLALAAVMVFSMAACGNDSSKEKKQSKNKGDNPNRVEEPVNEYTYVPEYVAVDEDIRLYNAQVIGDIAYYLSGSYDEKEQKYTRTFCQFSLTDKALVSETEFAGDEDEGRGYSDFYVLEDGSFSIIESLYAEDGKRQTFLCNYDKDVNKVSEQEITEILASDDEYGGYVSGFLVDGEGRVYLKSDDKVLLLNADGSFQGEVAPADGWVNEMCLGADGKVYITYYDRSAQSSEYCLAEINFAAKKIGTVYRGVPGGNDIIAGGENEFIIRTTTTVYTYNLETQKTETLFSWLDSDMSGDYVQFMHFLDDGRIVVFISDWETREANLAFLTKTKTEELPQKEQIIIGTLRSSQELLAATVAFNRQSDKYRVVIRNYIDENAAYTDTTYSDARSRMSSDIVSETNSPDIIYLEGLTNVERLSRNGMFEDLNPYLEGSSQLKKDDYLQNVLDSYTYEEILVGIPKTFTVSTIVGKTSGVGEKRGWTLDEMMAYAKENSEKELFEYMTQSEMLQTLLSCNSELFIDYGTGKASFDSEEFKEVLKFVMNFPEEYNFDREDNRSTPIKIQAGDLLLEMVNISEFNEVQLYEAMYGEPVTFVGYPTINGGSGSILSASGALGISANAGNKAGAWAFIESFQLRESNMYSWGLPCLKSRLEAKRKDATTVEYVTDENGVPILDDDGNPIEQGGGGIGWGDWEYEYHTSTEEEADIVMELIESAEGVSLMDEQILSIIMEEAAPFFQNQKTVDDVAGIIQSRVQVYLNENQ